MSARPDQAVRTAWPRNPLAAPMVSTMNTTSTLGLAGVTVGGLAVNGSSTRLFATTYGSGIYVSPMPATVQLQ